ncbi:MAG: YfhO family protein [Armatimonadota bacterium]
MSSGPRDASPEPASSKPSGRVSRWLPLVFPLLALFLLWDVLLGGRVLLAADYLSGFLPWSLGLPPEAREALPQWNVLQWDGMAEFYPWRVHLAREGAAGRVPLWNPHVLSGTPFLANSQSAPLYPLHLLFYLPLDLSVAARMAWLAWLHLSLAGLGAFLLSRDLGARPWAALVAGVAYQLSGFSVAWLELPSFIAVTCWIPFVLLGLRKAVREQRGSWCLAGGAAAGMMLLSGHLQVAFYGLLAAAMLWAWETGAAVKEHPAAQRAVLQRSVLFGAAVVGLGLALAAPQMLPSLELSRMSHRAGSPSETGFAAYSAFALPMRNWVTLLAPDYYGLPVRGSFWGLWNYGAPNVMEYAGHVSAGAFVLVLIGLARGSRLTCRAWLFALMAVVALLLAAGTPLTRLLYFYVPGFAQSGSPARVLVLFTLAQAMLAGLGLEWLLRRAEERWTAVLAPLGAGVGATAALLLLLDRLALASLPASHAAAAEQLWSQTGVPALGLAFVSAAGVAMGVALFAWLLRENAPRQRAAGAGAAAAVVIAGTLLFLGGDYNLTALPQQLYPPTAITSALRSSPGRAATMTGDWDLFQVPRALLPPNASMVYGWRDVQGYDSLYMAHYRRLMNALSPENNASPEENGNIVFVKSLRSPLFRFLGAAHAVAAEQIAGPLPDGFPPAPPHAAALVGSLPEAYLTTDWFIAPDDEGLRQLASPAPGAGTPTALVAPAPDLPERSPVAPSESGAGTAEITRRRPGRIVTRANSPQGGLLVLAEGYHPGWRAVIHPEGAATRPARVLRANVAFQGVMVPPGPVTVEWSFQPASYRVGLFAACAALAVLLAGLVAGLRRAA